MPRCKCLNCFKTSNYRILVLNYYSAHVIQIENQQQNTQICVCVCAHSRANKNTSTKEENQKPEQGGVSAAKKPQPWENSGKQLSAFLSREKQGIMGFCSCQILKIFTCTQKQRRKVNKNVKSNHSHPQQRRQNLIAVNRAREVYILNSEVKSVCSGFFDTFVIT